MAIRFVIIGGGPAGHQAATYAARLGAEVTLIERDIVGGAAHLWDCIPSKAMIATGAAIGATRRANAMGLESMTATLRFRRPSDPYRLDRGAAWNARRLICFRIRMFGLSKGTGRLTGPHSVVADTEEGSIELEADGILLCTVVGPRVPEWAPIDHKRVLTTRDAYPPNELPEHIVVVGSGVTGVEFVHMFSSIGSLVTLVVSREQVLPQKDPEAAAVLEAEFLSRGVKLVKGARAQGIEISDDEVAVHCDDGRVARGSHALLAIGSIPNSEMLGLETAGVVSDHGYVSINQDCQSNVAHIYVAGDCRASYRFRRLPRCRAGVWPNISWAWLGAKSTVSITKKRRLPFLPSLRLQTLDWPKPKLCDRSQDPGDQSSVCR